VTTPEPNQWNELKLKRNQLRDREKSLRAELDQLALTLRSIETQFKNLKAPIVRTSLRTELQKALASRKG
jgi:chromosome segregation ATPase